MKKLMMLLLLGSVSIQVVAHDRNEATGQPVAQRRREGNAPSEGVSESKGDDVDMPGGQQAVQAPQRRCASRNIVSKLRARSVAGKAVLEDLMRKRCEVFAETHEISDLLDSDGRLNLHSFAVDARWARVKVIFDGAAGSYFSRLVKAIDFGYSRAVVPDFSRYAAGFTSLAELGLNYCGLTEIPAWVAAIPGLKMLDLSYNWGITIFDGFSFPASLEQLGLDSCGLTEMPAWVGDIPGLRRLELGCNRGITISDGFSFPASLEQLGLDSCGLTEIPAWVGDIPGLRRLHLCGNPGITISPDFAFPETLEELELHNCSLTEIPAWVGDIPGLKKLDLRWNSEIRISPDFSYPETLEELDLRWCGLTAIPAGVLNRRVRVLI